MNESLVNQPRRVIPRWRDFRTTAALGELDPIAKRPLSQPLVAGIGECRRQWTLFRSPVSAGELLASAVIAEDLEAIQEAANYLLLNDVLVPSLTKEMARLALRRIDSRTSNTLDTVEAHNTAVFDQRIIGLIRRSLSKFPFDPIHWTELALAYASIGKMAKAEKAMLVALKLAPDDRFVVRCATRCFIHLNQPDQALYILNGTERTRTDSWLLAAHLSTAEILGKSSKHFRHGKQIFEAQGVSPFHLSELGAAIATTEMTSGNDKKAKKLFKQSLVKPTENALAQALWAKEKLILSQESNLLNVPRSFEANARILVQTEKWDAALEATRRWLQDEPFSARPAVLGSYIASLVQDDFSEAADIARSGLAANPEDVTLVNNLAFALALDGKPTHALRALNTIKMGDLTDDKSVVVTATSGLISYRLGNIEEGRRKYSLAIEVARQKELRVHEVMASIYLAKEEIRVNPISSVPYVGKAIKLAKCIGDPAVRVALSKLNADMRKNGVSIGNA